ncbi:MAG: hypothetical protein V4440_02405 [Pseudomonadota bacterium]
MTLNEEEKMHLENITFGGLMRTITPSRIEEKLLQSGYARKTVGGLMPTETAHKLLSKKNV